jgi:hypothetical protein
MSQAIVPTTSQGSGKKKEVALKKYTEEFVELLPGTLNTNSADWEEWTDKWSLCRNPVTPDYSGISLFHYFWNNRVKPAPICNPWDLNMAKLIVPDIYVDIGLIRELAKNYCPVARVIRKKNKETLVSIDRRSVAEVFGITGALCTDIDLTKIKADYAKREHLIKKYEMPKFMPRVDRKLVKIPDNFKPPFDLSVFHHYVKCTAYGVSRVLGLDGDSTVSEEILMIAMNIQHPEVNTDYDYVGYIVEAIHDGLVETQSDNPKPTFKHYSHLMYMILYYNRASMDKEL